jgi:DNA-binding NarL/FixJ family response regulator
VAGYDLILCDIRGVGQKFASDKEGAFLIKQIKAIYPEKRVIAYTASTYDPSYNEFLELADGVIVKGVTSDVWSQIIDDQIKKSIDPIFQWEKTRERLLKQKVDITIVSKLEHEYVKAIKSKDVNGFTKFVNGLDLADALKKIVIGVITSTLVKIITGGIL